METANIFNNNKLTGYCRASPLAHNHLKRSASPVVAVVDTLLLWWEHVLVSVDPTFTDRRSAQMNSHLLNVSSCVFLISVILEFCGFGAVRTYKINV